MFFTERMGVAVDGVDMAMALVVKSGRRQAITSGQSVGGKYV
jgi:hypothetical protein